MKRPLDYRDPRLVIALVGALHAAEEPALEEDLVATFSSSSSSSSPWSPATVKRTLGELVTFGAARRSTGPPNRRHPAAYTITPLGRAWADRRLEPYVGPSNDEEDEGGR